MPASAAVGSPINQQNITANGQTFTNSWLPFIRAVLGACSFTGLIIAPGFYPGQTLTIINTGTGSLTFAVPATSNVANGTSCVIGASTARIFVWDDLTAVWYQA